MRKIEVKLRQIIWAFKQTFKPTTYDRVIYQGNKFFIKSSLTGENIWNLTSEDGCVFFSQINGKDLKIIHSFSRFKRVFKYYLTFQKTSWGLIDCGNPFGTRLSYKNSEDIYFRRSF